MVESLLFIEARAGAGKKKTRSRSKTLPSVTFIKMCLFFIFQIAAANEISRSENGGRAVVACRAVIGFRCHVTPL